jgi:hypothetical protein
MPVNTMIEEMASERWCQALALSRSESKRRAVRKVYRYNPSLARIVKPDTHKVMAAGATNGMSPARRSPARVAMPMPTSNRSTPSTRVTAVSIRACP